MSKAIPLLIWSFWLTPKPVSEDGHGTVLKWRAPQQVAGFRIEGQVRTRAIWCKTADEDDALRDGGSACSSLRSIGAPPKLPGCRVHGDQAAC